MKHGARIISRWSPFKLGLSALVYMCVWCWHVAGVLRSNVFCGTSLIRTPIGQKKVSILVRCPEHYTVELLHSRHDTNGTEERVYIARCPYFRGYIACNAGTSSSFSKGNPLLNL